MYYEFMKIEKLRKKFTLEATEEAYDLIENLRVEGRYLKWCVTDAALRLLVSLPADIQSRIIRSDGLLSPNDLYQMLRDKIIDDEIALVGRNLPPEERAKFLLAGQKKAGKKDSRT